MQISNADIAVKLDEIADLLDIEGSNPFRIRAYRRAARMISTLPREVCQMLDSGENLDDLPGIGSDLAAKIAALAQGRNLPILKQLERKAPRGIAALLAVPGLGPKRVHVLHERLGVENIESLVAAAKAGKLQNLPRFGATLERKILNALTSITASPSRITLSVAEQTAEPLLAYLRQAEAILQIAIAGSYRRRQETIGDIDIVVATDMPESVMQRFVNYENTAEVIEQGTTRATIRLQNGLQVDLRAMSEESFGAAMCYFTGSKAHNIALRQIAVEQGLKLNEYGLFAQNRRLAGRNEKQLYTRLGLQFIPPELREDKGELQAALHNKLPRLVTLHEIRGDLHTHTNATDGRSSLEELVQAAQARGYAYLAITDHSRRLGMAHGLDVKRLSRQIDQIDRLNEKLSGFTVLKSIEVDILENGTFDLPNSVLGKLDFVVGAIHSHFDLPIIKQTERVLRAMDNRYFNILAHPTGRLISKRQPYAIDMEQIMRGALERGCFLECNAQPDRLDLMDSHCKLAKSLGLKVTISTDAHAAVELDFMRFGLDQARRGWLEPQDVLNTLPLPELLRLMKRI